jgi:hypothetical protein
MTFRLRKHLHVFEEYLLLDSTVKFNVKFRCNIYLLSTCSWIRTYIQLSLSKSNVFKGKFRTAISLYGTALFEEPFL